jgi:hypothetical protein
MTASARHAQRAEVERRLAREAKRLARARRRAAKRARTDHEQRCDRGVASARETGATCDERFGL